MLNLMKAGQEFYKEVNKLWIDLHTCSTGYACYLFDIKTKEAYKYGVTTVEFIYGTPDKYEGSIEEAFNQTREEGHQLVTKFNLEHAGMTVIIKDNPSPEPRDEDMCFSSIEPEYDKSFYRQHDYLYPLYPYRKTYTPEEISNLLGCSVELVRDIAKKGYNGEGIPDAESHIVYNEDWKKNIKTWYLTNRSLKKIEDVWNEISNQYKDALAQSDASNKEINEILKTIRSIPSGKNIVKSAKTALTRLRKS
jgi:hypothetical protein